jgi:small ubiquitin-related modifier
MDTTTDTTSPSSVPPPPAAEDVKPVVGEFVTIKVKGADNTEVHFKVKPTTKLAKLMESYCTRQGVSQKTVRFLFDGNAVQPDDTVLSLHLENEDTIDVMQVQTGGC